MNINISYKMLWMELINSTLAKLYDNWNFFRGTYKNSLINQTFNF